jgi:hypothetical protein
LIAPNQTWTLIFEAAFSIGLIIMITRSRKGLKVPAIRKVSGLEALDEAIGRATELGQPVHYSPGIGDFQNSQTLASFAILGYVARMCAKYDTRLITTNRNPVVYSVTEEIVHQAFVAEGRSDSFVADDVRFMSDDQFAYASGVLGIMAREHVATNVMMGAFWAESLIFAEAGAISGAIQIAGTANTHQIPFFVAACDYALIGEELYAASAYLSKDPVLIGNLVGQDFGKIFGVVIILIGTIMATMGNNSLSALMKK